MAWLNRNHPRFEELTNDPKTMLQCWASCNGANDTDGMKMFGDIIQEKWNVDVNDEKALDIFITKTIRGSRTAFIIITGDEYSEEDLITLLDETSIIIEKVFDSGCKVLANALNYCDTPEEFIKCQTSIVSEMIDENAYVVTIEEFLERNPQYREEIF